MKFGFILFPTRSTMMPGELAELVESLGFESLFFPDHTHIPSKTPEVHDVARLPREFSEGMDCFVALAAAAQTTTSLQLGTAVALVPERDHFVTAKAVASLDVISNGRMNFGVGPGWIYQELRNHGVEPKDRFQLQRERVEAMRQIWTEDVASHQGEFINFDSVTSWPKPVQRPHPPILVAGNGPNVARRVLEYGDEWIPMLRPGVLEEIKKFKQAARKHGSDEPIPVTLFGGELEQVDQYEQAGIDRCLFWPRPSPPDELRRQIESVAAKLGDRLCV